MTHAMIVIAALESEIKAHSLPDHIPIVYSGIGKINAAIATFQAIQRYQPQLIINFGTVGKINPTLSGLVTINKVIQRDISAEPLAPRGIVPLSSKPNEFIVNTAGYVCGTGDSFVTQHDPWLTEQGVDVVDMELFAIAAISFEHDVKWISYKYISDAANEDSAHEWSSKVHHGEDLFLEQLKHHL
jgi:adenosylhomocysteine nucleosidase